ncbi:Cytochrome b5 reductase 4 [Branchiostoma belcheri]|nr:Cytochrome b5 reductase 4 [Branchiostoma belcheri]
MSGNLGVPQFPAPSSAQRVGGGRNKVALKPGRSLMDWIRLSKSRDLSGTGGRLQNVTPEELAKHDTESDAWTAIRGKVYNVTAYAEYHPGGAEELMRAAGRDGTDLFNEVHRWVNYESMLESCLVGRLRTTLHVSPNAGTPKRKPPKVQTGFLKPPLPANLTLPKPPGAAFEEKLKENSDGRPVTSVTPSEQQKLENTGGRPVSSADTVDNPWPTHPQPSKPSLPNPSVQETVPTDKSDTMDSSGVPVLTVESPIIPVPTFARESVQDTEAPTNKSDVVDSPGNTVLTVDNPVLPVPTVARESVRYDWFQSDKHVNLVMYTKRKGLTRENVILDKTGREFELRLFLGLQQVYQVHVELEEEVTDEFSVTFGASGSKLDVRLTKVTAGRKWRRLGSSLDQDGRLVGTEDCERRYRACTVESRAEVTYDTTLYRVQLPPGSRMWVPAGHHVYLRSAVSGVGQVERPYTPVPASLTTPAQVDSQGTGMCLMIKVYPQGVLTPVLAELQPGDHLDISDYDSTLALPPLDDKTSVAFLVAGTGFTPGDLPAPGPVTMTMVCGPVAFNQTAVKQPVQGTSVIVLHPGSSFLRIGRASDTFPHVIPQVIARRRCCKPDTAGKHEDRTLLRQEACQTESRAVHEQGLRGVQQALMSIITSSGQHRLAPPTEQLAAYNAQVGPQIEDTSDLEWTDTTSKPQYLVGQEVLYLHPSESYNIHWPMSCGQLHLHSGTGGSLTAVLADLETIWTTAIEKFLEIPVKDLKHYRCILLVPDIYNRQHIKELINLLLNRLGFSAAIAHQESVCATFGSGVASACVVDVGDQKTAVCCVEDGLSHRNSRLWLDYGGRDVTRSLEWLLRKTNFPYKDCNLLDRLDCQLLQELKHTSCHLNKDQSGARLQDVHVQRPDTFSRRYQIRVGEETIQAPMGLFYPQLFGLVSGSLVHTQLRNQGDPEDIHDEHYLLQTQSTQQQVAKAVAEKKAKASSKHGGEGDKTSSDAKLSLEPRHKRAREEAAGGLRRLSIAGGRSGYPPPPGGGLNPPP